MTNNFKNKVDSYLSSEIGKLFIRYKNDAKDINCTEKELGITIDDALKYVLLTYGGAYIGVEICYLVLKILIIKIKRPF